jgi:hypothetical protein
MVFSCASFSCSSSSASKKEESSSYYYSSSCFLKSFSEETVEVVVEASCFHIWNVLRPISLLDIKDVKPTKRRWNCCRSHGSTTIPAAKVTKNTNLHTGFSFSSSCYTETTETSKNGGARSSIAVV